MSACALAPLAEVYLAPGFCAGTLPITIGQARSIAAVGPTDFLALERSTSSIKVVEDLDLDGIPHTRDAFRLESWLCHDAHTLIRKQ
jgi:hypothetical protein